MNKQLFLKLFLVAASINGALYAMNDPFEDFDKSFFPDYEEEDTKKALPYEEEDTKVFPYFAILNKSGQKVFVTLKSTFFRHFDQEYIFLPESAKEDDRSFALENNQASVFKGKSYFQYRPIDVCFYKDKNLEKKITHTKLNPLKVEGYQDHSEKGDSSKAYERSTLQLCTLANFEYVCNQKRCILKNNDYKEYLPKNTNLIYLEKRTILDK